MEETLPEESQLMPLHVHGLLPVHPRGVGVMDLASLAMTAASSAETWRRRKEKAVVMMKM